jgi:hypothetical protein
LLVIQLLLPAVLLPLALVLMLKLILQLPHFLLVMYRQHQWLI